MANKPAKINEGILVGTALLTTMNVPSPPKFYDPVTGYKISIILPAWLNSGKFFFLRRLTGQIVFHPS